MSLVLLSVFCDRRRRLIRTAIHFFAKPPKVIPESPDRDRIAITPARLIHSQLHQRLIKDAIYDPTTVIIPGVHCMSSHCRLNCLNTCVLQSPYYDRGNLFDSGVRDHFVCSRIKTNHSREIIRNLMSGRKGVGRGQSYNDS